MFWNTASQSGNDLANNKPQFVGGIVEESHDPVFQTLRAVGWAHTHETQLASLSHVRRLSQQPCCVDLTGNINHCDILN